MSTVLRLGILLQNLVVSAIETQRILLPWKFLYINCRSGIVVIHHLVRY